MDEIILKEFFNKIKDDEMIKYSSDIKVNLVHVAIDELNKLNISYAKDKKSANVLHLFSDTETPLRYVKGFYPNNSRLGKLICQDKYLTQRFLDYSGVKTPVGKMFKHNQFEVAKSFVDNSPNKNFVLKPVTMSMSLGTYLNVNSKNIENSWIGSFDVQKKYNVVSPRVLIQEQIQGLELRIIVVEGEIGSAVLRGPGNVKGDGKHTIEELIHIKNKERAKHNYLNLNLLKINENLLQNLKHKNLTLETVLPKGEYCILYSQSGIATGREVYEVSKYLDDNIYQQVKDAVTAIPGAHTAGVDIFVDSLDANEGTIIEVNLNPAFQLHYYPMTGNPTSPLYDVFKYLKLDRQILNDELDFDTLTEDDFKLVMQRYKYLFHKQKNLSQSFKMFLDLE